MTFLFCIYFIIALEDSNFLKKISDVITTHKEVKGNERIERKEMAELDTYG